MDNHWVSKVSFSADSLHYRACVLCWSAEYKFIAVRCPWRCQRGDGAFRTTRALNEAWSQLEASACCCLAWSSRITRITSHTHNTRVRETISCSAIRRVASSAAALTSSSAGNADNYSRSISFCLVHYCCWRISTNDNLLSGGNLIYGTANLCQIIYIVFINIIDTCPCFL